MITNCLELQELTKVKLKDLNTCSKVRDYLNKVEIVFGKMKDYKSDYFTAAGIDRQCMENSNKVKFFFLINCEYNEQNKPHVDFSIETLKLK